MYSNDLFSVFGCDVQQEGNWEFVNAYTTLILFSNRQYLIRSLIKATL